MILCLCDDPAIVRALNSRAHRPRAVASPETSGLASDRERIVQVHRLPKRLTTASAFVGTLVERLAPRIAVVATSIHTDSRARVGVVYRAVVAGEAWIPDVPFDHACEPLSVAARGSDEPDLQEVSAATAAGFAAALAVLGPQRVLFVAGGSAAADLVAETALDLAGRLAAHLRLAERRTVGPNHVAESVVLGGEFADRLRLTATQRAHLLGDVRSAAVRGVEVPDPLRETGVAVARTKDEGKRRLAELEWRLREWKRAEV